jgi:RHS repeat-associated protein
MAASHTAYESESVVESLDYFPYGGQRIDTKTNYGGVRNKYAGTVYDVLSGLDYMQARYENSNRGQFISEDPVFLGDPSQQNLRDPQSLNSYAYANDNPITKSDPNGKFVAAAAAPLVWGGGASMGLETMGLSMLVAGGVVGAMYLAEGNWPSIQSGAPGNFQATQMVSGNGANTDPEFPFNKPPGRWGGLALTTGASLVLLNRMAEYFSDRQKAMDFGLQWRMSQNYINWTNQPGVKIDQVSYNQNLLASNNTEKPTYTGPTSNGTNPNFASQTYQVPSGAIVDWGGNIVVPASKGGAKSK